LCFAIHSVYGTVRGIALACLGGVTSIDGNGGNARQTSPRWCTLFAGGRLATTLYYRIKKKWNCAILTSSATGHARHSFDKNTHLFHCWRQEDYPWYEDRWEVQLTTEAKSSSTTSSIICTRIFKWLHVQVYVVYFIHVDIVLLTMFKDTLIWHGFQ